MSGEVGGTGQSIADRVIRRVPLQAVKIIIVAWQIESQASAHVGLNLIIISQRVGILLRYV